MDMDEIGATSGGGGPAAWHDAAGRRILADDAGDADADAGPVVLPEQRAERLREEGNAFFKAEQLYDAEACYRKALALLGDIVAAPSAPGSSAVAPSLNAPLSCTLRLNLVACLQRQGTGAVVQEECVRLCDEVISMDPENAKAFFRRGSMLMDRATAALAGGDVDVVDSLKLARRDLVQAARLQPSDRTIRVLLDQVTTSLRAANAACGESAAALRLSSKGTGLYDDRVAEEPPPAPPVCLECGRAGHELCGRDHWEAQRAAWRGKASEPAEVQPPDLPEDGMDVGFLSSSSDWSSEGSHCDAAEYDALEDCLMSVDKPYPQPLRPLPLRRVCRFMAKED